jgi:hypothetical protein
VSLESMIENIGSDCTVLAQSSPHATDAAGLPLHNLQTLYTGVRGRLVLLHARQVSAWASLAIEADYEFLTQEDRIENGHFLMIDDRLWLVTGVRAKRMAAGSINDYWKYPLVEAHQGTVLTVTNGLLLWLEADAYVAVDGSNNVLSWSDHRGASTATYSPGVSPLLVQNAINRNPAVDTTGVGQPYLTGTQLSCPGTMTIYAVVGMDVPSQDNFTVIGDSTNRNSFTYNASADRVEFWFGPPTGSRRVIGSYLSVSPVCWRFRRDANDIPYFAATSQSEFSAAAASGQFIVDSIFSFSGVGSSVGRLAALLLYNRDLVASGEDATVMKYIKKKYALTIP